MRLVLNAITLLVSWLISWQPSPGADRYIVERSAVHDFLLFDTLSVGSACYSEDVAIDGERRFYRVRSCAGDSVGAPSRIVSGMWLDWGVDSSCVMYAGGDSLCLLVVDGAVRVGWGLRMTVIGAPEWERVEW